MTDSRRWWALGALVICLLTLGLDGTILNVALPTLATELGASTGGLQWIVDAYILVFAGLLLPIGALGDRIGRRGCCWSGSASSWSSSVARPTSRRTGAADRGPRAHGARLGDHDPGGHRDPAGDLPAQGAGPGDRDDRPRPWAWGCRSGRSSAAGCSTTSGGARCSW